MSDRCGKKMVLGTYFLPVVGFRNFWLHSPKRGVLWGLRGFFAEAR
jgi:hypothetical protein